MLNKILLVILFMFVLNQNNKIYEGTRNSNNRDVCGNSNLKMYMFDERCSSTHTPSIIENCIGENDNFSKDSNCKLCNNNNSKCIPTFKGGYCNTNDGKKDADGNDLDNTGRNIGKLDEEELRDYDEEKYNNMKNECNSFYSMDDDDEEDEEYESDEDDDELDKIYKKKHKKKKKREKNESKNNKGEYHKHDNISYGIIIFFFIFAIGILLMIFNQKITNITGINLSFLNNILIKIKTLVKSK